MLSKKSMLRIALPKPSFILVLLVVMQSVLSGKVHFLERTHEVSIADADSLLAKDLVLLAGTTDSRLQELEVEFGETFKALPKNSKGRIGHQAVLYTLHRMFVHRHGWHISGLAPGGDTWRTMVDSGKNVSLSDWVPTYLVDQLEERLGNEGVNLRELAALAATLEDLVRKDAVNQMELVYQLHEFPTTGLISRQKAETALDTYFMVYLLARKFSADSKTEAIQKHRRFTQTYHNLTEAEDWLHKLELRHLSANAQEIDFSATSGIAKDIGEEFSKFNDLECMELKAALGNLKGRTVKGGRVRLPDFYNYSRFSHWRFTERPEYLKAIGAFDDSDPKQKYVIVPNYIQSRSNCLQASSLYAVCCRNECEDLMKHLETKIAAPTATPDVIAKIIAALPSDTQTAPWQLPRTLLDRLNQVAEKNLGQVNLHGRLFAQWMSHAYPWECPYPHEAGTTSEQTPAEWKQATGQTSHTASEEEMRKHVESDTCPATGEPCDAPSGDEEVELPWSEGEELLVKPDLATASIPSGTYQWPAYCHWIALASAMLLGAAAWRLPAYMSMSRARPILAFCSAVALAFGMDLLDIVSFIIMFLGGLGVLAVRQWLPQLYCVPEMKSQKSCV